VFNVGLALYQAWRATVISGIAAYDDIYRFPQPQEKIVMMNQTLDRIWIKDNIFFSVTNNTIHWNMIPPV
jgi:hypothetical protein